MVFDFEKRKRKLTKLHADKDLIEKDLAEETCNLPKLIIDGRLYAKFDEEGNLNMEFKFTFNKGEAIKIAKFILETVGENND